MKWEKKLIYLRTKRCRQRQLEWGWPWQFNESSKFNGPTLNKVTCYIKITIHNLSQPPHHVDSDNHQPSTTPTSTTSWQRPHLSTQLQQQEGLGLEMTGLRGRILWGQRPPRHCTTMPSNITSTHHHSPGPTTLTCPTGQKKSRTTPMPNDDKRAQDADTSRVHR